MKFLMVTAVLCLLPIGNQVQAVTEPKRKKILAEIPSNQAHPRETQKAGQDIELRKVQAMLSGQRPKKVVKADPRR